MSIRLFLAHLSCIPFGGCYITAYLYASVCMVVCFVLSELHHIVGDICVLLLLTATWRERKQMHAGVWLWHPTRGKITRRRDGAAPPCVRVLSLVTRSRATLRVWGSEDYLSPLVMSGNAQSFKIFRGVIHTSKDFRFKFLLTSGVF